MVTELECHKTRIPLVLKEEKNRAARAARFLAHMFAVLCTTTACNESVQMLTFHSTFSSTVKAMLHEAIFLATSNATMTNKKPFKLQRVCYTLATSFATCNAYNNKQDGGRAKSPRS